MSYRLPRGRNAPPDFLFRRPGPDAPSLHDRKLAAWALSVGASVPLAYPERQVRRHRGELADLDMSLAGPDPGARPLLHRIARWLGWLRRGRDAKTITTMSGSGAAVSRPRQMIL